MTSEHVFFIPAMLLAGAALGWVLGRKALLAEQEERRRTAERRARREEAAREDRP